MALVVLLGLSVLLMTVLIAVLSLLRPAVATIFIVVVVAVVLFSAVAAARRSKADDDYAFVVDGVNVAPPYHRLRNTSGAILAAVSAAWLFYEVAVDVSPLDMDAAPPPMQVTAPYAATAQLNANSWEVHEEIRLDDQALQALQVASHLPAPAVVELLDRLPDQTGWQLDRLVDGARIYVRDSAITVEPRRIRVTRAALDIPELTLVAGVQLVPRSESSAVLSAPRAAVAATTPPAEDEVITAEDDGIARTVVPVDDSTDEVTVAVLGSWLRTPVGERLYDLSTWPLLPYAIGVVALALAVWLRTWILRRLVAMAERLRKGTASDDGDGERLPLQGGARRLPRPRPQHSSVAGTRRRRDRLPTPREGGPPRRAKRK